ncbi:receptor-like protein 56 [Quercus suber]|uniref:Receptor-like protein 56 n=1 Tax=Quercus suber TaxID=58331 RepID=A0AAW0L647_QUESU
MKNKTKDAFKLCLSDKHKLYKECIIKCPLNIILLQPNRELGSSHYSLSGEFPPQLLELTFLVVFSVAYSNLLGKTPGVKAQFGTFDVSSYERNPFLCGLPLEKKCTRRDDSSPTLMQSSDVSDEKWYEVDQTIFITCFSITYIMHS